MAHLTIHRDQLLSASKLCSSERFLEFLHWVEVYQVKDGIQVVASDAKRVVLSTDDSGIGHLSGASSALIHSSKLFSRLREFKVAGTDYIRIPLQKSSIAGWVFSDSLNVPEEIGRLREKMQRSYTVDPIEIQKKFPHNCECRFDANLFDFLGMNLLPGWKRGTPDKRAIRFYSNPGKKKSDQIFVVSDDNRLVIIVMSMQDYPDRRTE